MSPASPPILNESGAQQYVAIGRHIGCDWRTAKAYGEGRQPGVRRRSAPDRLARFAPYLRARFADDPHVWASALFDEVGELGYELSYPSFVRQVRAAGLRPHCEACDGVRERDTIEIAHPPGEEIQWDWFERRKAPWGGVRAGGDLGGQHRAVVPGSAGLSGPGRRGRGGGGQHGRRDPGGGGR